MTNPGPFLMHRPVKATKCDPSVKEVQLLECNPESDHLRFFDRREDTVSIYHSAPSGQVSEPLVVDHSNASEGPNSCVEHQCASNTAWDSSFELDPIVTPPVSFPVMHINESDLHLVKA